MALRRPSSISVDKQSSTNKRFIRLLSVVTIIGVLAGVAGLLIPRAFSYENSNTAGERKEIAARTTDFAIAYNTYDVTKVDDYQSRLKGLLSDSYYSEFTQVTDAIFKSLEPKKQVSKDAKVLKVAVEDVDKDSAIAIVAVDSTLSNSDVKAPVGRHLRWRVSLVKQSGQWNVSKFESVGTVKAEAGTPTPTTPTEGTDQ